ncbi:unnamed protein product [Adineta steineri]|uniref:Uncharacterized protein n=1 Tax=Adineta steineri TaxID=433720 RepID=A0A818N6H2_9BILA|nr:unnamed protein product [Adineta steineri]CAF3601250.1 unnamed protein product [Adineta steineri]
MAGVLLIAAIFEISEILANKFSKLVPILYLPLLALFAATEMTVSASASLRFKYGLESTEEKSQKYTIEVTLPSNTTMDASLFVLEGTAEVPYVAQITVTYTDDTEKIVKDQEGKYRGVQASNVNAVFGPAKPIKTPSTM